MKARHAWWGLFLLVAVGAALPLGLDARDALVAREVAVRHITLDSSVPADGGRVSNVSEIRLFFSEAPLMRGASIRIVNSARSQVRSSAPAADSTDASQLFVTVPQPLAPGTYVVQYRCIAEDAHVMRGDIRFEVVAE
jgi:methionine-rich copper-binding protein CopC